MNVYKNNSISKTLIATRQRRKSLVCKTYELKFDTSHISNNKLDKINQLFRESKWLYNHILSLNEDKEFNIFKFNPLIEKVITLDKDKNKIERDLDIIGSQIKQSVHNRLLDSIKGLAKLKAKGYKIGKLKFKSHLNSIPLKQAGVTYRFSKNKNQVKIQNIKSWYRINGLKQIPQDAELARIEISH